MLSVSRNNASRSVRTSPPQAPTNHLSLSESLTRPPPIANAPLLTWSNSCESASSLPPPLTHCERPLTLTAQLPWGLSSRTHSGTPLDPPTDVSAVWNIDDTTEYLPRNTVSSFAVLPSTHLRAIPRPLPVPLSLIPQERVQISPTAGGDLDMTLYVFFLQFLDFHRVVGLNHNMPDA